MKTERRHELQTNQLANSLSRWIEATKPYSRAILAVLVALVVVVFAWGYMAAAGNRRAEEGWTEYFEVMAQRDPRDGLGDIVTQYSGTQVGQWARLVLADLQLDTGTSQLFRDPKEGKADLQQAVEKYRTALIEATQPMLEQRATFGLARAHEALNNLSDARSEYRSIGEKWPDSPFAAAALARAKALDQQSTKSFYDWFAKYEPPHPLSNQPGIPGKRPDFLKEPIEGGADGSKLPTVTAGGTPPTSSGPTLPDSTPESPNSTPETPAGDGGTPEANDEAGKQP